MDADQWSRVERLFHEAAELAPAERAVFLDGLCREDAALRNEVESLLAADSPGESLVGGAIGRCVEHLSTDTAENSELPVGRVGPYCITGLIGKGGMGAVYRAVRDDHFRMEVAIKLLKRGTDTDAALGRFRIERQILAGLQHPNIARLLDGGATEAGLPYFVMEYVDGTPLMEYAAALSTRRRLELFRAVCSAVQYAHGKMVVHRDIKPPNILVTKDGIPKLLDFGIAKLLDPTESACTTGMTPHSARFMTPDYASPEQMRGERVTTATDVYSLGMVLYELLTGRRGHVADDLPESKKPSAMAKELDADLDNIVLTARREEPERRYASAAELSDDIDRYLQNLPVHARAESLPYHGGKFLRRHRAPVLAAGVTAVMVLALIAGVSRFGRLSGGSEAGVRSIAVLPLANLSGDREQDYFAEGVTDDLIGNLAHIQGLRVISRTSSMSFQGVHRPLPEIARSLGVQTIAEGSVMRRGSRIRLDVRLFDAPKDRAVWSRTYEGELEDLVKLQDQVVAAIASEIGVALHARNASRLSKYWRVNLAAYDAYLKGRHQYTAEFNEKSMQQAIGWFQRALVLDPNYAPAYAGLADCYYMVSNQYYAPSDVMPKAKAAAMKAIELDDSLGEAHATLALVRSVYEFKHAEAEKGFRHALELKPSDAEARIWFGLYLVAMGRFDEAAAELEQARLLDPVSPALNGYAGAVLYYAHRYDEVIQRMAPIIEKNPEYQQPYAWLALAYEQKGEWPKAIATMEKCVELDGFGADGLAQLGHMYAVAGRSGDARRMLQRVTDISRRRYVTAWDFALLHAGLGERDESLHWLEKVEEDRSEMFVLINVDPRFDALRSDPRFAAVLRSAGLRQ